MSEHEHADMWSAGYWDERYSSAARIWSGNPNQRLVEQAAGLTPATALDVGCGEGADAIWLAGQGWSVTGVDISQVALDKAAAHARDAGLDERIVWQQADLLTWVPEPAAYDLVSAQFMHLRPTDRDRVVAGLAAAVRRGGSLLVVGHDFSDTATSIRRPHDPELYYTADQIAALLDPADWEIGYAGAPTREVTGPDGERVRIADAVLHALRH